MVRIWRFLWPQFLWLLVIDPQTERQWKLAAALFWILIMWFQWDQVRAIEREEKKWGKPHN